jgi:hypothetical protein
MNKTSSAHEAICGLLNDRLQRRLNDKLDRSVCMEIYGDIFFSLTEVIKEAQTPLDNEAVNLLAQMYYDSVTVNGNQELDPSIFTQRAKMENIPTKELALLATMMNGTPFAPIFISEIKKRS